MIEGIKKYVLPGTAAIMSFLFGFIFLGAEPEVNNHETEVSWSELSG